MDVFHFKILPLNLHWVRNDNVQEYLQITRQRLQQLVPQAFIEAPAECQALV